METKPTTRLLWAVHCHQPVGNFDFVFEHAYQSAYLPFLDVLERHPQVALDFHFSGPLFDWLDKRHPDFLDRLGTLLLEKRAGLLGGAYYEPILPPIPFHDQVGQIVSYLDRLEERLGVRPKGMWVAERVWEPQLPAALSKAGIEFVLLDGTHFKQVGIGEDKLFGAYNTEHDGKVVTIYPIHDTVRDYIPFASVEDTIGKLKSFATPQGTVVTFGDDGEKFGDWPGTNDLCYKQRWLDRFFEAIEADDSLSVRTVSETHGTLKANGLVYLSAASYFEMMEWAESAERQSALQKARQALRDSQAWDAIAPFVRGVSWKNFLVRYPESNRLHKLSQNLSFEIENELAGKVTPKRRKALLEARDHVWQSQCNCGYWHGVFGGLYLPHLRRALHGHLARAERIVRGGEASIAVGDWDLDGGDEVWLRDKSQSLSVHLNQGGGVPVWWLPNPAINLADTMTRTLEAYHAKIDVGGGGGTKLQDQMKAKEEGLAELLRYDVAPRQSALEWWFPEGVDPVQWAGKRPEDHWVAGPWTLVSQDVVQGEPGCVLETKAEGLVLRREMRLLAGGGLKVRFVLSNPSNHVVRGTHASEWMFALLAGDAPDRLLRTPTGETFRLGTEGRCGPGEVVVSDGWLELSGTLRVERASGYLWQGLHSVSQSVSGYEKVFQGTAVLALRPVEIPAHGEFAYDCVLQLSQPKDEKEL